MVTGKSTLALAGPRPRGPTFEAMAGAQNLQSLKLDKVTGVTATITAKISNGRTNQCNLKIDSMPGKAYIVQQRDDGEIREFEGTYSDTSVLKLTGKKSNGVVIHLTGMIPFTMVKGQTRFKLKEEKDGFLTGLPHTWECDLEQIGMRAGPSGRDESPSKVGRQPSKAKLMALQSAALAELHRSRMEGSMEGVAMGRPVAE